MRVVPVGVEIAVPFFHNHMKRNVLNEKFKLSSKQEQQILDLFYEHKAPVIYNKALDDARYWCQQQAENLQSDYYLLYCDIR